MNKRSGNKVIFNIAALAVMLITVIVSCIDVFASEPCIRAYDECGLEIGFNENNYALNAGRVTFILNSERLAFGESYVYDDGGVVSPVEDGRYIMEAGSDGELKFVNFYIQKGSELRTISSEPYIVEFADSISLRPDAAIKDEGRDGSIQLEIGIRPWVNTFLTVDNGREEIKRQISRKTSVSFEEDGQYRIGVYTMDGRGNKTYSKKIPEKLIVDRKPPIVTGLDTEEKSSGEGYIFSEAVTLKASVWDERSGIDSVYYGIGGEEVKADSITVNPPFKGSISCRAMDKAGNMSEDVIFIEKLTVDDEKPVIDISKKAEDSGILKLLIKASDGLSGVKKIVTRMGGEKLSEKEGDSDEISIDLTDMDYGEKKISIYAYDRAGNMAEGSCSIIKSDTTAPVITFLGVSRHGVYGRDTDVTVDVSDDSGRLSSYTANVLIKDGEGRMVYSQTTDAKRLHITQTGIVTVTASASDYSGNDSTSSVTFTVDKEAPVIRGVEKYDGGIFETFEPLEEAGDMIDDLSCVTYDIYLNGLEYDGSRVSREGNYVLKVTAMDEFGNRSGKKAEFALVKEESEVTMSRNAARQEKTPKTGMISMSQNKTKAKELPAKQDLPKESVSVQMTGQAREKTGVFKRIGYGILKLLGLKK